MDKAIIIIILTVVVLGFLFWGFQTGFFVKKEVPVIPLPEGIVLFFGEGCPHCKLVEDFISQNKISEKVQFTQLEIPYNGKNSTQLTANAGVLVQVAQECKLDISGGVNIPFLWDGQNCLVGDEPIINFFKTRAGIQ